VNPKLKLLFKPRNLPLTLSLLIVILAIPLTVGLAISKNLQTFFTKAAKKEGSTIILDTPKKQVKPFEVFPVRIYLDTTNDPRCLVEQADVILKFKFQPSPPSPIPTGFPIPTSAPQPVVPIETKVPTLSETESKSEILPMPPYPLGPLEVVKITQGTRFNDYSISQAASEIKITGRFKPLKANVKTKPKPIHKEKVLFATIDFRTQTKISATAYFEAIYTGPSATNDSNIWAKCGLAQSPKSKLVDRLLEKPQSLQIQIGYPPPTPSPTPCSPPSHIDLKLSEANNGSTFTASVGQIVSLSLEELSSAGYSWQLSTDKKYLKPLCERTIGSKCGSQPEEKCIGGPVSRWYWYEVIKSGQTNISAIYCRPWDCQNTTQKKLNIYLTIYPKPTPTPYLNTPHPSSIPSFETSTP
jgi:predicted secreted protein